MSLIIDPSADFTLGGDEIRVGGEKMNPTANLITNNQVCGLFSLLGSYF